MQNKAIAIVGRLSAFDYRKHLRNYFKSFSVVEVSQQPIEAR